MFLRLIKDSPDLERKMVKQIFEKMPKYRAKKQPYRKISRSNVLHRLQSSNKSSTHIYTDSSEYSSESSSEETTHVQKPIVKQKTIHTTSKLAHNTQSMPFNNSINQAITEHHNNWNPFENTPESEKPFFLRFK